MSATHDWPRIKDLFQQALDRPTEQRREFVRTQAGDEPELRDAVLRMLDLDEAPPGALDRGAHELVTADAIAPPNSIGPYRVERELGRGGMGVVLLATRCDGDFAQQVAIKLIRGGVFDTGLVARFRREREILARLVHPHIARLTDGGVTDDGLPWYAMEFIEGEPLGAWCDARQLSLRDRVTLFLQVLQAVDYAHRNLVVHRDLKPSNMLVTGSLPGQVKLLDFGIAKLLDEAEGAALTGTDMRLMTPDYAAPEQILGEPISTATDVYALGVVLFELLCGRLPYPGTGPRVAAAIVDQEPERLKQALSHPSGTHGSSVEELARRRNLPASRMRAALDADLEQVVAIALAKRAEERYASVAAMAEDLRAWSEGRPLLSRPVPWPARALKFVRRNRLAVSAAAAVVIVALAGMAATWVQWAQARREAETAQAVRRTLTGLFAAADPDNHAGVEPSLREVLDLGVEQVEADLALQPAVRVPLLSDLGAVYTSLGDYPRASELLTRAQEADLDAVRDPAEVMRLHLRRAEVETALAHYDAAESALAAAQALMASQAEERAFDIDVDLAAARIADERDREPEAISRLSQLVARLERAQPPRPLDLSTALSALGNVQLDGGHFAEGAQLMRRSLEQKRLAGANPLLIASAEAELGRALRDNQQPQESEAMLKAALDTQVRVLGADHPTSLTTRDEYAISLQVNNRLEESEREFRRAIEGRERRFGADHPIVAYAVNNYGVLLYTLRRFEEALANFERAHRIWKARLGPEHLRTLQVHANLAGTLTELGRLGEARSALEALVAVYRERGQTENLYGILLTRGLLYERLERERDAKKDFAEALAIGTQYWGDYQRSWVWAQVLLARAESRLGETESALARLEDAVEHYQDPSYRGGGPRVALAHLELSRVLEKLQRDPERQLRLAQRALEIRREKLGEEHTETLEARAEVERRIGATIATPPKEGGKAP